VATSIGATTPGTGVFSTLEATSIGSITPGTIVGTTIDATTDFTVGGTVITDNTITDDGIFYIDAVTSTNITKGVLYVGVNNANDYAADLRLYSGLTANPAFRMYVNDGDDGNGTTNFVAQLLTDDYYFGPDNDTDAMIFYGGASPNVQFTVPVDVNAALTATTVDADTDFTVGDTVITDGQIADTGSFWIVAGGATQIRGADGLYVGINNNTNGDLRVYGNATGSPVGGFIQVYPAYDYSDDNGQFIDYYQIYASEDDLIIGPDANTDAMKFVGNGVDADPGCTVSFTVPVDVDAALTATTVDADTDFTVGSTVITDGVITDATGLQISATTTVLNNLYIGEDDTGQEGLLRIYGGDSDTQGGTIELYFDAGYDTNHNYVLIWCDEDSFHIGTNNNNDAFRIDASAAALSAAFDIDLSIISPASLIMGDVSKLEWDPSPASDATMSGEIISQTVDANASGIGALLYKASDGNWEEADASASSTIGMLGIAVESGTGTKDVLLRGFVKDTAWSWTPGAQLFVSETTGAITSTAPTTSGSIVQVVGYATEATVMYFNPSVDYAENV
jgi:hypothetical protein